MATKTTKERNWFIELLWTDEQNIQKAVAEYNTTPWYLTYRFGLLCFVVITLLLSALLYDWLGGVLFMIFMIPLGYFIMRGYRFSYVLLGLFRIWDFVLTVPKLAMTHRTWAVITAIIFAAIWLGLCISCYRIETARHKKYKDANKVTTMDKILLVVCGLFTLICVGLTVIGLSDPKYKLEQKYGAKNVEIAEDLYINTVTIPEMCKDSWQGLATAYNEKNYTNTTGEELSKGYVRRYMYINGDIIAKIPETLIKEFGEVAGEKTTKTMTKEFIKIGQDIMNTKEVDSTVYGTVCYMLLTVDDEHIKIK